MQQSKRTIIVGIMIILSMAILFWGIHFLEGKTQGEKKIYYAIFPIIGSLNSGDPVNISGVRLGEINQTQLIPQGVMVSFWIKSSYKDYSGNNITIRIPINSTIAVENVGLMGERAINITLGNSIQYYQEGDTLGKEGIFDAGIPQVLAGIGEVLDKVKNITSSISQTSKYLSDIIIRLDSITKEQKQPISSLIENSNKVVNSLDSLTSKMNQDDNVLSLFINNDSFAKQIETTVNRLDSLLTHIKDDGLNIDLF